LAQIQEGHSNMVRVVKRGEAAVLETRDKFVIGHATP
jgi:hypothetical protein